MEDDVKLMDDEFSRNSRLDGNMEYNELRKMMCYRLSEDYFWELYNEAKKKELWGENR